VNIIDLYSEPASFTTLKPHPVGFTPRPKSMEGLKTIIRGILLDVQCLHSHGLVHRDIRWANIIKETNGRVRLIDLENAAREGPKLRSRLSFQMSFYPSSEVFLAKGQAKGQLTNLEPGSPAMLLEKWRK